MTAEVNRLSSFGNASRCVHSHPALGKWRMKEEGPRPMNFNSYSSRSVSNFVRGRSYRSLQTSLTLSLPPVFKGELKPNRERGATGQRAK